MGNFTWFLETLQPSGANCPSALSQRGLQRVAQARYLPFWERKTGSLVRALRWRGGPDEPRVVASEGMK